MTQILMLLFNQVGKGTYWRAMGFARELVQRGYGVTLVATSVHNRWRIHAYDLDGVRIIETPDLLRGSLRSGWDPWNTLRRIFWLRGRAFDLIHAFEARPTVIFPALIYRRRLKIPLIMDWADWFGRGGSVEERPNRLLRTLLRPIETYFEENFRTRADGSTVICTTLQQKALALGVPEMDIARIPNGSEPEKFPDLSIPAARQLSGLDPQHFIIGYVGTIFQADARLMAAAFDLVLAQAPHARLLVIGHCPVEIHRLSTNPQAIIQTGPIDEARLRAALLACDIFWLPLRDTNANRGRWPLKLNDYLAAGRPTVATDVGDVGLIFRQAAIGLLVPDQAAAIAGQTMRLIADPTLRTTLGENALKLAGSAFTWSQLTGQLISLYQRAGMKTNGPTR